MINSITVDLNGQSMVQQNQLIDIYNTFLLLTSESWTSKNRWSFIGLYPDLVSEAGYASANYSYAPAETTSNNADTNVGLTKRLSYIDLYPLTEPLACVDSSIVSGLITKDAMKALYLSHVSHIADGFDTVGATKYLLVHCSVKATIMLKDIHPLFEVMPISKSLNFKIQVFWNNFAYTATHDGAVWSAQSAQYRAYNGTIP
jgi:hypothetical protein